MRIEALKIKNVMSYRELTTFQFGDGLNILIGPNGGGKSNAQRIILVLLTRYFLPQYVFSPGEKTRSGISLSQQWEIDQINKLLDRYVGDSSDQEIQVTLKVEESDLENMRAILANLELIRKQASFWNCSAITALSESQINQIEQTGTFEYSFLNNQPVTHSDDAANYYLGYLRSFFMIARLAEKIDGVNLRSPIFYFSSTRQSDMNFSASASHFTEREYYNQYQSVYDAATGGATNLIQFATRHFGRLMIKAIKRSMESTGLALEFFEEESDVKLVRQYLKQLGYEWNFLAVDDDIQNFVMQFYKNGEPLDPAKFSSGEREIFHFLFAAFALNVEHGLIMIDEPELHLHPRWQRIFLDLFYDLSEFRQNQFILATHSPGFVTPRTIGNITRIYQEDRTSHIAALAQVNLPNKKDLVHIVNSHNNERLFFADDVILVEGISDRLVFSSLISIYCREFAITRTVEVIEVSGKHNFSRYKDLCDGIVMPVSIVADRDYLREVGSNAVKQMFVADNRKVWNNLSKKKGGDRKVLCEKLEVAIENNNTDDLKQFWAYLESRGTSLKKNLGCRDRKRLITDIKRLQGQNVYVLRRGEIEDYLPDGCSDLAKIIELIRDPGWLQTKIKKSAARELNKIVRSLLAITG